ncbi:nonribosomal peptide synthase, putative [Talaromyces stipitatus ATCC 10500]|uniref:Nonribosomal peptide synthase, putative n=1 Tax=Talaromyces stipitatus (strain ATCC 10500 / CBS 375.48 / QM 6759 / NRRL 1006) TaxID=441959 RepID=B8MDW9_TALSN|nr:nonribosomal peptide synthase, putative [Talaromyces stipitatus ATCC 10500]EED16046.1 nonribosomal peptide synthase, putative [Talaromyces stipitatus ATCC 10500]
MASQTQRAGELASLACYLPSVRNATANTKTRRRMCSRINCDAQKVKDLFKEDESGAKSLLQAVWGMVLHYYTGMEEVCFGYNEFDMAVSARRPGPSAVKVRVDTEAQLEGFPKGKEGKFRGALHIETDEAMRLHYNTAVMLQIRNSSDSKPSPAPLASQQAAMSLPEECKVRVLAKYMNGSFSIFLEYKYPDISADFVSLVSETFSRMLHALLEETPCTVQELSKITDSDMRQIIKWNAVRPETVERCIHNVIEDQVQLNPQKEAVCAWDGSLTYFELNQQAFTLAQHLLKLGVRAETRVALYFDKSKWNIVAMLAVLKAGGAFVPLDPSHPIARLESLVKEVEANIIICSTEYSSRLSSAAEHVLHLDTEQLEKMAAEQEVNSNLTASISSKNAAYVLFTSGSTGKPKATVIEHQAFCSGAHVHGPAMLIEPDSRVLQFAAHTFDASLVEILTPLMHGACVCIPSEESRLNGIVSAINNLRVNHAFLTPSFIRFITPADVPNLTRLVLAGEALTQANIDTWSSINLVNGYGPTESSVAAVVNANITKETAFQDIGFPVGVRCWVVDPENHDVLLPIGCTGELLLEGPSLARCYLNNPEKTAQSFISNPSWSQEAEINIGQSRFYKTGDLVRYNSDAGSFDFVGRKDTQVKYHGQRIELGEIESHLIKYPTVKHGLVLLPKTGPAAQKLVAIFSFSEGAIKDFPVNPSPLKMLDISNREEHISDIREAMSSILPAYMIPSIWLCIEAFPVLASRKLDRKTVSGWLDTLSDGILDSFRPVANDTNKNMDHALTDIEATLREIWSDVLNIPLSKTSIHHSFLSLGGDSITAMTCMNRCKQRGIGLTVQDILRSRSIQELSNCVRLVDVQNDYREDIDVPFDLSPIQKLHFEVRNDVLGHFNQSFFLRINHFVSPEDLRNAMNVIVSRHSMLRARFFYDEQLKQWRQRLKGQNEVSYRFNVHKLSSRVQVKNAIADSQASLDAVTGPVVAIDLFQMEDQDRLLSLIGHHLVVDLVSWRVILEDLEELLLHSQSSSLLGTTLPYQSWSRLQWEQLSDLKEETTSKAQDVPLCDLSYWGISNAENTYGHVSCESFELDAKTTSILLNEANSPVRTEAVDILVAALLYSFAKTFTDHALPVIHNEGHGREPWDNSIDVSRTVGWFTIIYPIFVQATALRDWIDTLIQVKDSRRRVKDNGREYFAKSSLSGENMKVFKPMEITFNYLGRYQQLEKAGALFSPVEGLAGETSQGGGAADFAKTTPRFGLFEISAVIVQDVLRFTFSFNGHMRHQERIRQWVTDCQNTLVQMTKDLVSRQHQPTLSDYPLLSLNYPDLKALTTEKLPALGLDSLEDVEDIYPCSAMQRGLLLSTTRDISFYAVRGTYEVKGDNGSKIDAHLLSQAWQHVVDRHAMLRTIFVENISSEDLYSQVVLRKYDCSSQILSCSDEDNVRVVLDNHSMQSDRWKPLHKFTICVTEIGKVFCRLEMSHVIMDGTSISIILRDLEKAYSGCLQNDPKPLFSNFVSYLQSQPKNDAMDYWKSYLSGIEPCHMPVLNDGSSSSRQYSTLRLDFQKLDLLQSVCEKHGLTLANALHGAWAQTLRCYTGSNDICFGYLLSERDVPVDMVEETVGPIINMLACRVNMSSESILMRLVEGIQADYMASIPFKHISLADVQHELNLSGTALFNTCLSYRKLPSTESDNMPSIQFSQCAGLHDPTEYLVTINVEASDTNAAIDLDFWTDMLSQAQAKNIADTFIQALENIIEQPETPLGQLNHVPASNWQQIAEWNKDMPETIEMCIHEVFDEQVRLNPEAPAICSWDGEFTYSQVDSLSTRLSYYLTNFGVMPESFVALCFDKSAYTIIAMIAVLKAGGACVPLDAGHPKAALELRVLETGAQVVLSSPSRTHLLDDVVPYAIPVDETLFTQLEEIDPFVINKPAPENSAFVIFTSGSTGKPKGVVLEHRSLVTSAAAHGAALGVDQSTRFLQFASYSFDNSLEEIFTTLMRGGCVCVPSEEDRMNNLAKAMNDLDVNFSDMTATVAAFLNPSDVPKLKGLAIGGEAPTKEIKDTWCSVLRLQNIYGPTECSINCCHNPNVGQSSDVTNIGRAVGGVSWVVDANDHNNLVPIGCVGELLIEGPILARHYLHNPEKTQQSFIEDPSFMVSLADKIGDAEVFSPTGHRMYKTGDLVRYNSDGTLVYLGRKDTQVKLNGQRIELGEIEHRIQSTLPSDGQCSVDLIVRRNGDVATKALVVFVCLESDNKKPTQSDADFILPMTPSFQLIAMDIKSALASQLQSYMVPNVYIPVSFFPMTSSGKLNRRQLRTTAEELLSHDVSSYRLGGRSGREPSTHNEKVLQNLWSTLLSVDASHISADDTFFRHGGDSISAMRLITAARKQGYSISVADIFQTPRLSEIAQKLVSVSTSSANETDVKISTFSLLDGNVSATGIKREISTTCQISPDQIEDVLPCSAIQEGLIVISNSQPGSYVTQNTYELPDSVDIQRFKAAWQKLYQSESILRTRIIHTKSNGFLQVVVREELEWGSTLPLPRSVPGANGGRLSRYTIAKDSTGRPHFVWTAHHAIYDGWSIPKLLSKLQRYYEHTNMAIEHGPCSYSHFIKYVSNIQAAELKDFWVQHLNGFTAVQFPALPNASYKSNPKTRQTLKFNLPEHRPTEVTLPSLIRAAWALTVSMYSYSEDIVFGEIMTGRDIPVPGIDDMIGPALSIVPMRLQIDSDLSVIRFLQQMQAQTASIIPYQSAGLQNIQGFSQDAKSACEFRTLFSIAHGESDDVEGVMRFLSANTGDANFFTYPLNVSCFMWESDLEVQIQFDNHIIPLTQLKRVMGQFEATLHKLCIAMAEEKLSSIEVIGNSDISQIQKWNNELSLTRVHRCIHDVIDDNIKSRPDALAIDSWDGTFTYAQLGHYATALANHLRVLIGNDKEQFIPICFEKSAFAALSMLAVMKAGYAFVPIDPQHPKARRQEIVSDIDAKVILCSPRYVGSCQEVVDRALAVDLDLLVSLPEASTSLGKYDAKTAAYVIFTSGSTGKPKGCIIEHAGFCSGAVKNGPAFSFSPTSRVLQFASYTFDASLLEILTVLVIGGCTCVPHDSTRLNGIAKFINEKNVNTALLTPSMAQTIKPSEVPCLENLALVGEAMTPNHLAIWANEVRLINGYGPTETSIVAAAKPCMTLDTDSSNIGLPVGNAWIVDPRNHDRLMPIGAIGELLIEGPTLARGYLNNEQKTQEVFITNPAWGVISGNSQRRMYKTGDLVRYAPDDSGELLYVGRKDSQAKLHGQRLELGEIEHHLNGDNDVLNAIALLPKMGRCSKKLVSVLSLRNFQGGAFDDSELHIVTDKSAFEKLRLVQDRLREKVPAYMTPSTWVVLQQMPLLPSGKLNRKLIDQSIENIDDATYERITSAEQTSSTDKVVVITQTEATLRNIWASVLNLSPESISLDRSFLHLGGDSMSAMAVMSRCRGQNLGLTVENIITCKSIRHLASLVTLPQKAEQNEENYHEFDLSPIQILYFQCMNGKTTHFNQSIMIDISDSVSEDQVKGAVSKLVSVHSMLRARFSRDRNGIWKQRILQDTQSSYGFRTVEHFDSDELSEEVEETQKSLDVTQGPVMAITLFQDPIEGSKLFICAHHLVVDVISWGIIVRDLEDLLQGRAIAGDQGISFQKWCRLQLDYVKEKKNASLLPLDDIPAADMEFWGMKDTPNTYGEVVMEEIELNSTITNELLKMINGPLNCDVVDILLAALLISFRRVFSSRKSMPCIYNEGHGREPWDPSIDLSNTVGWFTTMSPVHLPADFSNADENDLHKCISWVKALRRRTPGKGMPYFAQRLLTWEGRERYQHHWPMEMAFNYLGQHKKVKETKNLLQLANGTGQSVNSVSDIGPDFPRFSLIEISAAIVNGSLKISVSYNKAMKRQGSIRQWIGDCRDLICRALRNSQATKTLPSLADFPLLPLSYNTINKVTRSLQNAGITSFDNIEDIYPCSSMQHGILLSQLKDPNTYAYRAIFEVDLPSLQGRLDVQRLAEAWQSVVDRHMSLRTTFIDGNHEASLMDQVVFKTYPARIDVLKEADGNARQLLAGLSDINFKNGNQLHRLSICPEKTGRVFCRFDISNAIADGTSMPIIFRDLSRAYMGLAPVTERKPQYSDFVGHLLCKPREKSVAYWKKYLSGSEPCLFPSLVNDQKKDKSLGSEIITLKNNTAIRELCKGMGITMSAIFQFVWAMVLRTYTGSDEVCFGYISSGRDVPVQDIEDAVGAFINMLIYKIHLTDTLPLAKALKKTQRDFIKSMEHQAVSLAEVQHALGLADTPLFNTAFTFQRRSGLDVDSTPSLSFKSFDSYDPSEYKIAVNIEMMESVTEVHFSYWQNYLSSAQAKNIADTFEHIINDITKSTEHERTIGAISTVGSLSCQNMCQWNSIPPEKVNRCVHEMIEDQVRVLPVMAQAVEAWDAKFTYGELDSLANRLATVLVSHDVGPEVIVPLCFEKSAWAIVAQIAVLKAGGAFVSLDPSHPEDRLKSLVEDVNGCVVLSSAQQFAKISKIVPNTIMVNDRSLAQLPKATQPTRTSVSPTDIAYVIFTSGSTGKPKGTVIEHGQFCTGALAHGKALHINSETRSYQFANYTFDASILDILTVLILGGCVCVPSAEDRMNDVAGSITRLRANWMCITPSVASTLKPESIPTMKVIAMGGEKMTPGAIEKWSKSVCLVEAYGPSECSVVCAAGSKVDKSGQIVNFDPAIIGKAVGSRSWVVDQRNYNRLVPVGAIGELVIEGHIVGRGYLNNEKKTKEAFIQDPAWAADDQLRALIAPGTRMYRTGDLVRYNDDGTLTYMARIDMQIKLNGQRIELGEIEYQCTQHMPENVQLAVDLVAPGSHPGPKKLAMFFSLRGKAQDPASGNEKILLEMDSVARSVIESLEKSVAKVLPSYMIPQLFFPVSVIPFTNSGKLDRRKLFGEIKDLSRDDLKKYSLSTSVKRKPPTDERQITLQGLWEEVLAVPKHAIGSDDSFFRLGGDSLAAMKLVGLARSRGISLSVVDIFRHPTLEEMSNKYLLAEAASSVSIPPFSLLRNSVGKDEIIVEIANQCNVEKESIADIYPCSALQEGLITSSVQQQGAYISRNILRLGPDVDVERFKVAWQQLVDEFDILRTRIPHTASSGFLEVVLKQEQISWYYYDNLESTLGDASKLFNSQSGVLTRYILVQEKNTSATYFVWLIHHALYDAWGLNILLKRVQEIYYNNSESTPKISYSSFISYLERQNLQESGNFWKSYLANPSPTHFPPLANQIESLGENTTSKTLTQMVDIPQRFLSLGITVPILIRAAWALVLSNRTQSTDVCFGETLSGRNIDVPGIAELAGPVLTTVPTYVHVDAKSKIKDYLLEIQKISTEMISHQHFGLQHIKKLGQEQAAACQFRNLIVVQTADSADTNKLWEVQDNGDIGSFFTYPLVVECKTGEASIEVNFHYDEKVITRWELERISFQLSHVLQQLGSVNSSSTDLLATVGMLSPEDKKEIKWLIKRNPQVLDTCIHDLFAAQCRAQADAQAVHAWDGDLTYADLNKYASSFAAYLKSLGVQPEVLVPLCLDKSAWTIVSMYAVLMAGGAIVPLDPSHPLDRHREIVQQTGTDVLLYSSKYESKYAGIVKHAISIDANTIRNIPSRPFGQERLSSVKGSNAAYVIFTSGSTGKPKGIIIEHRAFNTSSVAFGRALDMNSTTRALQFASLSFDAAIMEIFTTLTVGGCVCVPSEDERLQDISGTICRMNVTWTLLTSSVANLIDPASVPSLKVLVCGGEAMSPEVIAKWSDKVHLINAYGPSEASVVAVVNPDVTKDAPNNIGYGIQPTTTWIVNPDDRNQLTPMGSVGELALGGPTLSRGYLGDTIKTMAAFIENPSWAKEFAAEIPAYQRIHLTGDLVKYRHDGSIDFIGRKDNQVKFNGQRMELGEIEHRLETDSHVRHVIVSVPQSGPLRKRLVAILSLKNTAAGQSVVTSKTCQLIERSEELSRIKNNLASQLPSYMVPQAWAVVNAIPMLVSGKLDRKLVKSWIENISDEVYQKVVGADEVDTAPEDMTGVVSTLREIWAQVLNQPVDKVKPNQSFLNLGGDSITAMAVVSRSRKHNIKVTLHDILRSPSLIKLAETVESSTVDMPDHVEVLDQNFGLSPIQQMYFLAAKGHQGSSRFNQSFTLRLSRYISSDAMRSALRAIVSGHSMLRARFKLNATGEWEQQVSSDIKSSFRFRYHNIESLSEAIRMIGDSQRDINIYDGPIIVADMFEKSSDEQYLFLAAHHLVVDVVSWRIITQDLEDILETGSLQVDKALSFQSWCKLQSEHVKRSAAEYKLPFKVLPTNLGYWGVENVSNTYGNVKRHTFTLDEGMTTSTMTACHEVFGTEPVDILLAAIIHSFRLVFTDRYLPTVFNEGHGRETWDSKIDLSRTVGWFTNISPLQVVLESDDVLDTLKTVKDTRRISQGAGNSYLAQRFFTPKDRPLLSHSDVPMEILFNYLGSMQQLERDDSILQNADMGLEKANPLDVGDMGPETTRLALFEISAAVVQHRLEFAFMFGDRMKRHSEINRWISECKWILEEIVVRLRRCTPEPTLSDYPLLPINYDGLKRLLKNSFPQAGISHYREVEEVYPCSPAQEGMLLSQLRDPKTYLFHVVFEVTGSNSQRPVDPMRLIAAWQKVVDRHAALRTVFVNSTYKGGSFDQAVLKNVDEDVIHIECDDSAIISQLQSISLYDRNVKRKQKIPHQLTVCVTPSGRVVMKIEVNHAVIDGGSTPILIRDLQLAYDGQLPEGRGPLYSDYIRFVKSRSPKDDIVYWKRYLTGIQACYFPRLKSTFSSQRRLASLQFNFDHWQDVQRYCERTGVTLANVIQAAWALVLRKYTNSDDVCFGYLSAGRDAPVNRIQETIGVFINMLCCRVRLSPSQLLAEIPSLIQDDFVRAIPHQRCSLAQVQHELGLQGKQIFNTALSIQNHSSSDTSDEGSLMFTPQEAHDPSEYAVTLNIETGRNQEGIVFRYWTDMLSSDHASDISKTLANILHSFAREPTETISRLDKCKSVEIAETKAVNVGQTPAQREDKLHDLLEKYPSLQNLIDERVRMIVQQMFNLSQPGSLRRHLSNATEHDVLVAPHSESDAISSISDDVYREDIGESAIPVAAHIHERGMKADIEEKLLRLWSDKLGLPLDSITRDDSFFDLGGDSITAMGLVGDARDEGLILTVADVFRNPIFKDMATMAQTASEKSYVEDEINNMNMMGQQSAFTSAKPGFYERFALIKAANIDEAFLQKYICPRVGVFKGGIVDILPVTDFQALSITGALLDSRWMLNFFCLDGRGPLDFRRLKQSCFRVVHAFDILRTVFVASKGRFLQVILRKVRPEFSVYETDESLDEFTSVLQQRDITEGVKQGEPFVQFVIVREKNTDRHRIILRLSHAQYDGVSLPRILSAIKAGYEGGPIPSPASFANFVRESARIVTTDHYQHWRNLLNGSRMTEIVNRHENLGYRRLRASNEGLRKTIRVPSMAHGNITTATVIKAAWALTLARITGSADIVFGHTISGRNTAAITGVESMVGPCMNIVPVRVLFAEKWTVLDLLRYIQDQQVANMPYEALGFRQIIHKCTDWPRSTNFSTVLQHDAANSSNEIQLGENIYTVKAVGSDEEMSDFSVNSKSLDRDRVEIILSFSVDEHVTMPLAQRVLDMLCDTAESFTANPDMALPSPTSLCALPIRDAKSDSQLPQGDIKKQVEDNSLQSSQLANLTRAEILVLSDVLRRAWEQVLSDTNQANEKDTSNVPPPLKPDSSFFDLGGDLIGLAQVAWLLEQEDFTVRLDDLIEHPTMMGQMAALVQSNSVTAKRMMASYHAGVAASSAGTDTAASATDGSVAGEEPHSSNISHKPGQLRKSMTWASAFGLARKIVKRKVEVES